MEGTRKLLLVERISKVVGLGLGDPKESIENFGDLLLEKLHQLLHILPQIIGRFVEKIKKTAPQVYGLTNVLSVALSLLLLYCFFKYCPSCCVRRRGGGLGMMMRLSFEGNPRGYFSNLRANKPIVY